MVHMYNTFTYRKQQIIQFGSMDFIGSLVLWFTGFYQNVGKTFAIRTKAF